MGAASLSKLLSRSNNGELLKSIRGQECLCAWSCSMGTGVVIGQEKHTHATLAMTQKYAPLQAWAYGGGRYAESAGNL
ncbi:hypothetical protein CD58_27070 [Pseudomonas brassicacearum]|nr:hypothetical protein CD58_27070 [Pseudomonas brassicacearum]